jgi:hypothetical protein
MLGMLVVAQGLAMHLARNQLLDHAPGKGEDLVFGIEHWMGWSFD